MQANGNIAWCPELLADTYFCDTIHIDTTASIY